MQKNGPLFAGLAVLIGLTAAFCAPAAAQTRLALTWQPEPDAQAAEETVALFSDISAALVILPQNAPGYASELLDTAGIPFLVNTGFRYFTNSRLNAHKEDITAAIQSIRSKNMPYGRFSGIILFNDSQTYRNKFRETESGIIEQAGAGDSLRFFNLLNGSITESGNYQLLGRIFPSQTPEREAVPAFADSIQTQAPYLVADAAWLTAVFNAYPPLKEALLQAESFESAIIPRPSVPEKKRNPANLPVILLLLLWSSIAANTALNPTYKDAISRYFLARRFFVDDVLQFRERSSVSGLVLLFQHAAAGGLTAYIVSSMYITETGLDALFSLLPYLAVFGSTYLSVSFWFFLIITLLQFTAVAWLYIFNPKLEHFSQSLNIYTWIFHTDFILITLLTVVYAAGGSQTFILLLAALYVLIWFNSFNLTAFDTSKKLGPQRTAYLIKTAGAHTVAAGTVIILLLIYNAWYEILNLIVHI